MPESFLDTIIDWAAGRPDVAAVLLTGSRARRDGAVDDYSDYDVELYTAAPERYAANDDWLRELGDVWVYLPLEGEDGHPNRLVFFAGGTKADFLIRPMSALEPRRGGARRPARTRLSRASRLVVPRYLGRGELWVVKFRDWTMKEMLLAVIEWHALARDGAVDVWHIGTKMSGWAPPDVWHRLDDVFGRFDAADSRRALLATTALFREVSSEVATRFGFKYPQHVVDAVSGYVESF